MQSGFEFYYPKISFKEIEKYEKEIIERTKTSYDEYNILISNLFNCIEVVENEIFLHKLKEANEIIGIIDIKDVPFIALALSFENDGIWSDDSHFKKQTEVKTWATEEIIRLLFK